MEWDAVVVLRFVCRRALVQLLLVSRRSCASSFRPRPCRYAPSVVKFAQTYSEDGAVLHNLLIVNFERHRRGHNHVGTVAGDVVMQWLPQRDGIVWSVTLVT